MSPASFIVVLMRFAALTTSYAVHGEVLSGHQWRQT